MVQSRACGHPAIPDAKRGSNHRIRGPTLSVAKEAHETAKSTVHLLVRLRVYTVYLQYGYERPSPGNFGRYLRKYSHECVTFAWYAYPSAKGPAPLRPVLSHVQQVTGRNATLTGQWSRCLVTVEVDDWIKAVGSRGSWLLVGVTPLVRRRDSRLPSVQSWQPGFSGDQWQASQGYA